MVDIKKLLEGQKEEIDKGMSLGAAQYLVKPCDPTQVISTVREILGLPA